MTDLVVQTWRGGKATQETEQTKVKVKVKEMKNGRAAMFSYVGYCIQAFATGN